MLAYSLLQNGKSRPKPSYCMEYLVYESALETSLSAACSTITV